MKILFVLEHYYPNTGGVEVLFKSICEGLVKEGNDVHVVTSVLENTKIKETINGVKIRRIRVPQKGRRYFFTFAAIPYLLRTARKFDLIHTTTYTGAPPAWLVSKIFRKPTVITVHEIIGKDWSSLMGLPFISAKMHQFFEQAIAKLGFSKYVCVSRSTQKNLVNSGVNRKRTKVIYNAVDYNVFNPKKYIGAKKKIRDKLKIKSNEFLYIFYGRPGVSKGVEYLADAIPKINELVPKAKGLFILGTDPKSRYEMVLSKIKKNADGNVIVHKPLPYKSLPEYLMAADVIVIPSITEGFGFCVAESCALGKPIIASNTTSIPEVASGKFLLVPARDSQAIAKAIQYTKEKKYMTTPLKKFTEEKMLKDYQELYQKLLKK